MKVAYALCVALALSGVAEASAAAPRKSPTSLSASAAAEVSRLRAASGLAPVRPDPALARAAEAHAAAMARAGVMSHDVGGSFSSRLAAAGIATTQAAENVAMGQRNLAEAMASWTASSGHRSNMLMRSATRIGLGRAEGPGGPYWTMILAAPEPPPRRAGEGPFGSGGTIFFGLPVPVRP